MSTKRPTSMADPVYLPDVFPPPDAAPAPGCGRCAKLAEGRTAARAEGDLSAVSDANVLIRRQSPLNPRLLAAGGRPRSRGGPGAGDGTHDRPGSAPPAVWVRRAGRVPPPPPAHGTLGGEIRP